MIPFDPAVPVNIKICLLHTVAVPHKNHALRMYSNTFSREMLEEKTRLPYHHKAFTSKNTKFKGRTLKEDIRPRPTVPSVRNVGVGCVHLNKNKIYIWKANKRYF